MQRNLQRCCRIYGVKVPAFSARIEINAAANDVFAFVSQTANMPRYLPTLERATRIGDGRVRLRGAGNGRRYEFESEMSVDDDDRRVSWASPGPQYYLGEFRVLETGAGSELACSIRFEPHRAAEADAAGAEPDAEFVEATVDDILCAVKQAVECLPRCAARTSRPR